LREELTVTLDRMRLLHPLYIRALGEPV
jgi:hypothetical protein